MKSANVNLMSGILDSTCKGLVMQLCCETHTHRQTYLPGAVLVAAISTIHSKADKGEEIQTE